MSSFYNSVVSYLQPPAMRARVVVRAPSVQILSPPIAWNWNSAITGQIPLAQLEFCDSMPMNMLAQNFVLSSKSFTDGYSSFLELIDLQTFPAVPLVQQNITNNILPKNAVTAAKGWAQTTNQAGQLEWRRVWNVTQGPQAWLASIAQNPPGDPVELIFNDPGLYINADNGTTLLMPQGTPMEITAKAIGRIQVSPDNWYNSAVVTIAESNKNYFIVDPAVVFGSSGLINCRIAEFIVALKPEPSITISNSLISTGAISEDSIKGISMAGFTFTNEAALALDNATVVDNVNFSLTAIDHKHTKIKGSITGNDSDNVFIIAVILETNAMSV